MTTCRVFSAGCGRTGSIIAIDLGRLFLQDKHLQSLEQYRLQPVFAIATHIRQFRIALIQTTVRFCFLSLPSAHRLPGRFPVLETVFICA